jgi:hypothetical protein
MNTSEEKAFNRLIQKLSALRQTLKGDEREMLDRIVMTNTSEVALHGITPPMGEAVSKKALSNVAIRRTNADAAAKAVSKRAASEIAIHEMDDAAAKAVSKKAVSNVAIRRTNADAAAKAVSKRAVSEIAIHEMDDAAAKAVSKKAVSNVAIRRTNADAAAKAVSKRATSEIAIHSMNVSKANAAQPVSYAASMRVSIDETTGEYRVNKT